MLKIETQVLFGEWLPDLPYYKNPGLVEAKNAIPLDGTYKDFLGITTADDALSARPQGAFAAIGSDGEPELYAGTSSGLFEKIGANWTARAGATYGAAADGYWRFSQFDDLVIATDYNDLPQARTVGSASNFADLATSGTAPAARQVGIINRFLVLGDTSDGINGTVPHRVAWSGIDAPRNWPTPGTSSARAIQSGEQFLNAGYGAVTAISPGQFYGLVFQQRAINRFTYVGGDIVFQIDEIDTTRGCWAPQSLIQVGEMRYFLAVDGFYATNGQAVVPIGNMKVDKWFFSEFDQSYRERMTCGFDPISKCVYWCFPTASATDGVPDRIIIFNTVEGRWAWADEPVQLLFSSFSQGYTLEQLDALFTSLDDMTISLDSSQWQGGVPVVQGFSSNTLASFGGDSKVATFETGEMDANPEGYVFIRGVRPLVTGDPTDLTVALSARTALDNQSRTFGTATQRTTRTGQCDFRTQGRFLSVQVQITGGFDKAIGVEYDLEEGDQV